jgi:hypothetical protein
VKDATHSGGLLRDSAEALSVSALADRLGVTQETVRTREHAGDLFSVVRRADPGAREYPAFQVWEGIAGDPLRSVLAALGPPSGPVAYGFFTSPQDTLVGLSPIEALLGVTYRPVSQEATIFLHCAPAARLAVVVQAARTYASTLAA